MSFPSAGPSKPPEVQTLKMAKPSAKDLESFFAAAAKNDMDLVTRLITEKKVNVDERDRNDDCRTILHTAAEKGYDHMVRTLVEDYKADINIEDQMGEVPMHKAADNGYIAIVQYLLECGSDYAEDVEEFMEAAKYCGKEASVPDRKQNEPENGGSVRA